jgi:hypothetical protein
LKPAYYLLAAVLLLIVGLAAIILVGTGAKPRRVSAPVTQEVYVDLSALLEQHPAYRALKTLARSTSSEASFSPHVTCPRSAAIQPPRTDGTRDSEARQQLEAATARNAVADLSKLEAVRNEALDAKLRLTRGDMIRRAAGQTEAELREIEKQRSAALAEALRCTALDRINALARIAALKTQSEIPILDQVSVKAAITSEKNQLGILEDKRAAERRRVEQEFNAKIKEHSEAAQARIVEALSVYEEQGRRQIDEDIRQARAALLSDLSARNGSAAYAVAEMAGIAPAMVPVAPCPSMFGLNEPGRVASRRESLASLEAALKTSVARAVRAAAKWKGLAVSFTPRSGLPDETAMMLRLLRESAWGTAGGAS